MMQRILILGGAGFIGSNLVNSLYKQYELTVIDNLSKQIHGEIPLTDSSTYSSILNKCNFIKGDITNPSVYNKISGHFSRIIFLVSETGTGQSMYNVEKYCNTNIVSLGILDDCIKKKVISADRIILSSSRAIYGDAKLDYYGIPIPSKETDIPNPLSIYAVTKLTQEQLLTVGFNNIEKVILRFQNVYGPGQSLSNPYTGILSIFSTTILNNKPIYIFEDGKMTRDFVYIDDVVNGIEKSMNITITNQITLNIGSGVGVDILYVAKLLKELYNSNIDINITGERRIGDIRHNCANMDKFSKLGYFPKYDIVTGLTMFTDWVKKTKINSMAVSYEDSLEELRRNNLLIK